MNRGLYAYAPDSYQGNGVHLHLKILYADKAERPTAALSVKINNEILFLYLCGDSQINQQEIESWKPFRSKRGLFYAAELI